jgi:hypothetical protein
VKGYVVETVGVVIGIPVLIALSAADMIVTLLRRSPAA